MSQLIPIKDVTDNTVVNIVLDTINQNKQIIVFVGSKSSAEKTAELIAQQLKKDKIAVHHDCKPVSETILHALSKSTKQCEREARCVEQGIAFHHAGLLQKQKTAIENGFRNGVITCICCTPTLAMGVDLPAYRTIIRDLKRFSKNWGQTSISVLEYHQMAGRAGRPGKDTRGEAITIAKTESEKDAIYEDFITADVEEIYSKLAVEPVLRTYLLSLIATEHVRTKEQIMNFFSKTFWAHQYKDMKRLETIINKMLALLDEFEFITSTKSEFTTALEYATESFKATRIGKRVAELYLDPLTAHKLIEGMKTAAQKSYSTFSLLQLFCSQLELRPLLTIKKVEYEKIEQQLIEHTDELLVDSPVEYNEEYDEFLKSIKTALFFQEWINESTEEELLKQFDVRPGELHAKKDRGDWLIYSAAELAKLLQLRDVEKDVQKLRIRVEQGVKEELFALLKFEGIGRVRARKLYDNKIKDIGDVKKIDLPALTHILGPALAVSLKKQVGIDVEKIPVKENKRKGQISLMDY
ncbi:MAG: helicase-related protein [Candidatus Woesearchaeota archaeon]|jgi:helicase